MEEISGILNGTTNYIPTKMYEEGWGFDEALKMAQKLGYAERNPEADIEGYDTCRKIAIRQRRPPARRWIMSRSPRRGSRS